MAKKIDFRIFSFRYTETRTLVAKKNILCTKWFLFLDLVTYYLLTKCVEIG